MADLYSELASVATELLGDFGQIITLSREVGGVDNPVTGETTGSSIATWSGNGVVLDYNASESDGIQVHADDLRVVVEAVDTPPKAGDEASFGSENYHVIAVTANNPAGTPLTYSLQLRL